MLNDECVLDYDGKPVMTDGKETPILEWMAAQKKHNTALAGFSPTADCCSDKTDGMKSDFKADFIPSVFVCSCLFFSVPFDIINRASRLIF